MNSAHLARKTLSVTDYLAEEEASIVRHELVDGVAYAMTGGTDLHNQLAFMLGVMLRPRLPRGCRIYLLDMKLRIKLDRSELYYYPDLMVTCSAGDRAPLWRSEPSLIVEVLSPATERIDRAEKLNAYRQIASLVEYVLVAQDAPRVEVFRRSAGWGTETYGRADRVTLPSIGAEIAVAELYHEAGFEEGVG